jgi:hypothetical protein
MEKKKILVIGGGGIGIGMHSALVLQQFKEQYGENIELYTPEQAQEQGIQTSEFANLPTFKIENTHTEPLIAHGTYKDGKQNRRERRNKERKSKKK